MPDQTDANVNAFLSSVRSLLVVIGTILAGHGLANSQLYAWVEIGAGTIMVIGPALWGVYSQYQQLAKQRKAQAVAVQAGINLVKSGAAVDVHGTPIAIAESPPAKPVTPETAQEIVKNFGPKT